MFVLAIQIVLLSISTCSIQDTTTTAGSGKNQDTRQMDQTRHTATSETRMLSDQVLNQNQINLTKCGTFMIKIWEVIITTVVMTVMTIIIVTMTAIKIMLMINLMIFGNTLYKKKMNLQRNQSQNMT